MSRKVFTAGEVLAAADVNSFLMDQTVMSFAGTAARGSAIGTATEGMTTFMEDTDRLESWTGSQWTSPTDLVLVKTQTIGTAVSSVTVTNAFSSAYDSYRIVISGGGASATGNIGTRLGASTAGYSHGVILIAYGTGAVSGAASGPPAANFAFTGFHNASVLDYSVDFVNPFLAKPTAMSAPFVGDTQGGQTIGYHNVSTSYTDFTIFPTNVAHTLTGGIINVYGYRKTI
jgi:hypothetical protein